MMAIVAFDVDNPLFCSCPVCQPHCSNPVDNDGTECGDCLGGDHEFAEDEERDAPEWQPERNE